jgi:neural Wiskott-Aldrich syndrome protein
MGRSPGTSRGRTPTTTLPRPPSPGTAQSRPRAPTWTPPPPRGQAPLRLPGRWDTTGPPSRRRASPRGPAVHREEAREPASPAPPPPVPSPGGSPPSPPRRVRPARCCATPRPRRASRPASHAEDPSTGPRWRVRPPAWLSQTASAPTGQLAAILDAPCCPLPRRAQVPPERAGRDDAPQMRLPSRGRRLPPRCHAERRRRGSPHRVGPPPRRSIRAPILGPPSRRPIPAPILPWTLEGRVWSASRSGPRDPACPGGPPGPCHLRQPGSPPARARLLPER